MPADYQILHPSQASVLCVKGYMKSKKLPIHIIAKQILPLLLPVYAAPAAFLSRSSIFRRAARTISSRLFLSISALSVLFCDHGCVLLPVLVACSGEVDSAGVVILLERL